MGEAEPLKDSELHRQMAVALFNRTRETLDEVNRTPAEDREMLGAALGSHFHWARVGDEKNFAISDWQVARVLAGLDQPGLAQQFAEMALRRAVDGNLGPFLVGCGHEVLARVAAVNGDADALENHLARADDLLSVIEDDEERAVLKADLDVLR